MAKKFPDQRIRKLDPAGLIDSSTRAGDLQKEQFFLSLALLFNDIKGVVILEKAFNEVYEKPDGKINFHTGQWHGVKYQIIKYYTGILHEALRLIEEHGELLKDPTMQRYYSQLNKNNRNIWLMLLNVCGVEHSENFDHAKISSFKRLLLKIRNNASFHYYNTGKSLINGYRKHFYGKSGPEAKSAMYSFQATSFDSTRYFYADAALQGYLEEILMSGGNSLDEINKMIIQIAKVVTGLLEIYHAEHRQN